MRQKIQWFDFSADLNTFRASGRDHDGRYQASVYKKSGVLISRWNVIDGIIWNIGLSVFQFKAKTRQVFHRESFHNCKVFDWDLDWRNEACSHGWQIRMSLNIEKNYWKDVAWKCQTTRILIQRTNSTNFNLNTPKKVLSFHMSFWWRNSNAWSWRKHVWILREMNKNSTF